MHKKTTKTPKSVKPKLSKKNQQWLEMVHTRISGKRNYYSKLKTCTKFKERNSALVFQLQRETTPPSPNLQKLPSHFTVSTFTTSRRILFLYYIKKNCSLTSTFTSILFLSLKNFHNLLNCVLFLS